MNRKSTIIGLSAMLASSTVPVRAQSGLPIVRAATSAIEDFALPFYAFDRGFFREAGIDVQLIQLSGSSAVAPAIVAGSIEFGITNSGAMSSAHVRGLPLYLLLSGGLYTPATSSAHVVVGKNSTLRQGRELSGKTIGINTVRDMLQAASMKWIQQDGGDPIATKWYEIPSSEMAAGIESGRLDAAVLVEPNFTKFKDRVRSIGLPYVNVNDGKPFQTTGAICNKDWADNNPDLARRVTRALARTADWANKNPHAAVEILAKVSKLDVDTLESIPRSVFATRNDPLLIQPVINLNFRYGFLPRPFPAAELYGGRSFLS